MNSYAYKLKSIPSKESCRTTPLANAQGDDQQRKDAEGYKIFGKAITRVRNKDAAGCQEITWTAIVTGLTIFIYHPEYQVPGAAVTHDAWSYILPQNQEKLVLPADMEKIQGRYIFLYSDGHTDYQAYLGNNNTGQTENGNHQEKRKKQVNQAPGQPKITSVFEPAPKPGSPSKDARCFC